MTDARRQRDRRTAEAHMRPYLPGEDLSAISVSKEDHPKEGGMIARNPANHADQWYINPEYVANHFEPIGPRQGDHDAA